MKQKKVKIIIILCLFFLETLFLFLTIKSFSNKEIKELKETYEVSKKHFSMFINDGNDNYAEYTSSNLFPEGYAINIDKSKCTDNKGNIIEGILSKSGSNVTVKTNKTAYCYLYFDEATAVDKILASAEDDLWDSTLEEDGYRYVGTAPANYICFGTTDTSTCTGNTDLYMYRIIGIFEDSEGTQHLKLIKKEALNTTYAWNADYETDIAWDASDLYNGINGSYFLANTTYSYMQDSAWTNKIATWDYIATNTLSYENYITNSVYGPTYFYNVVSNTYLHEMNREGKSSATCYYTSSTTADCSVGEWKTVSGKIGLMYASDYLLSLGSSSLSYTSSSNESTLKTGWMHITNNDSGAPVANEHTMSRAGNSVYDSYATWYIGSAGRVDVNLSSSTNAVRPVFYLTSDVTISGNGTIDNPYIIS